MIESRTTRQFWALFEALPFEVRQQANVAFRLFRSSPGHPSLHFKKLEGEEGIYSARISIDYRALAVMKGSRVIWYRIGTHAEHDRLV